ncbi:MAG TPA: hypothetical protein VEQ58_06080 [Polyangiaceae bacterium]|nr:hypothetical protein [Polyangiaceae bacterium]
MRSIVSVWTRWGDYVLGVRAVRPGELVSVGSPPRRLLSFERGVPKVWGLESDETLAPGQTVTVSCDGLDYTFSCSDEDTPSFAVALRRWAPLDALVLGALCAVLAWPAGSALSALQPKPEGVGQGLPSLAPVAEDVAPPHPTSFAVVAEPMLEPLQLLGESRCGQAEPGLRVSATHGRYGVTGPRDNADPHFAREALADNGAFRGSAGLTAPFGRDDSLGTDEKSANAKMWDDETLDDEGDRGLGLAGRVGGVMKTFAVAALADAGQQMRVLHTGLRISGARKASEVGRVMAAHFDEYRACADGAGLSGQRRVQLELDITPQGSVVPRGSSAGPIEQCLEQRVSRLTFEPGASDTAHVVYPLYFVAADRALEPLRVARPAASEACDCGG